MKSYDCFIKMNENNYGITDPKILGLLNKIETIFDYKVEFAEFEGSRLYIELEIGKGYSSNGWSINGRWNGDKLKIKNEIWDKDSYTNTSSNIVNKRSSYRNYKPKEFELVDALIETKLNSLELIITQELD